VSVLSATAQTQVEDKLVEDNVLTRADLAELRKQSKDTSTPLFGLLVTSGKVTNEQLTKTIAHVSKIPYVNLLEARIDPKVLEMLPQDIAERYMAVPLGEMQHRLVVAMLDADNVQAVDFLSNRISRPLKVYAASEEGIRQVLHQYSAQLSDNLVNEIGNMGNDLKVDTAVQDEQKAQKAAENITTIVQDSPISKALSTILEYAAKNRASDIHIEPLKESLKIRCRIDGILREIMTLPKSTEPPLVSRIKILSNLKIDEHRIPQDGEFTVSVAGKDIDLRISVSPVIWGEQVVIRLLDKSGTSLQLEEMRQLRRRS
jgi:type IV pilus assembly protein PilB